MKQLYTEKNFQLKARRLIETLDNLIADYLQQGFKLTVRQLYYQLVSRDIVPNTEKSYKYIARLINDARLAGLLDWEAIEDRTRGVVTRGSWESGSDILNVCAKSFHMDMWETQTARPFIIIEKDALSGVLSNVCHELNVPLLSARGYPSSTTLRELALVYLQPALDAGQHVVLLHFGDHDPSGLDMSRDLEERLQLFLPDEDFAFERVALNMPQIKKYKPPPNPAKETDARYQDYCNKHGSSSWELDALEPRVLVALAENRIQEFINEDAWSARKKHIKNIKKELQQLADDF
jgi:hypothetical protein